MRVRGVSEAEEHPDRVPGDAHLASAAPEFARLQEPAPDEQLHSFRDPRVLLRHPEFGEDEEPPVRRDVLWPVQLASGRPRSRPVALRVLFREDLRGPPLPPDLLLGAEDRRIVLGPAQDVPEHPEADARVRVLCEEPIPHAAAEGHVGCEIGSCYIVSNYSQTAGVRYDRLLSVEAFRRVSRLSSAWLERVTVVGSRRKPGGAR